MARGPVPQPDSVKRAKGNPGKRALPPPLKEAAPGEIRPTGKLRQSAMHVWRKLAPELQRQNMLRSTDSEALSRYCDTVVTYWEVSEKLRVQGVTYTSESPHGTYQRLNPLFVIQERLATRLSAMEDRFGLTPAARQSIMVRAAQLAAQPLLPLGDTSNASAPAPTQSPIGLLATTTRH